MLSRRVRDLGLSPTLAISDLARRLRAAGEELVDFSVGQPDFPSPESVKAAGRRAIDADRTRYTATAGIEELRRAIADRMRERRAISCDPDQILVSPGAKASLYFACMALLEPGDEVLIPAPYWTSYPEQVRLAGASPVFVHCAEERGFKLGGPELERAVTPRSKALILNYPSNPTGVCYSTAELEELAAVCLRRGLWIVADEIYSELTYDGFRFSSIAAVDPQVAARTLIIDGVSKTYSMTGWRVGYAVGPRELIAGMVKLQSHCTSNATSISQWASLEALSLPETDLAPRIAEFSVRRRGLLRGLRALPGVSCVTPQGAFYLFPNVSARFGKQIASGEDCARYLLERARVTVVPGEAFGSPQHIRLSYAVPSVQLEAGLERIGAALAALEG